LILKQFFPKFLKPHLRSFSNLFGKLVSVV
jgi:hypothetical protein